MYNGSMPSKLAAKDLIDSEELTLKIPPENRWVAVNSTNGTKIETNPASVGLAVFVDAIANYRTKNGFISQRKLLREHLITPRRWKQAICSSNDMTVSTSPGVPTYIEIHPGTILHSPNDVAPFTAYHAKTIYDLVTKEHISLHCLGILIAINELDKSTHKWSLFPSLRYLHNKLEKSEIKINRTELTALIKKLATLGMASIRYINGRYAIKLNLAEKMVTKNMRSQGVRNRATPNPSIPSEANYIKTKLETHYNIELNYRVTKQITKLLLAGVDTTNIIDGITRSGSLNGAKSPSAVITKRLMNILEEHIVAKRNTPQKIKNYIEEPDESTLLTTQHATAWDYYLGTHIDTKELQKIQNSKSPWFTANVYIHRLAANGPPPTTNKNSDVKLTDRFR
jgi:hypothetical protein